MQLLRVGEPYILGRRTWPEGAEYNYRAGGHELRFFWANPTPEEVEGIRIGQAGFALLVTGPVIWFLYQFQGACAWSDAPYSWHLVRGEDRVVPPTPWEPERRVRTLPDMAWTPETRALLHVTLVDAATGIVRALRVLTLSPEFTRALHKAILEQTVTRWDEQEYEDVRERAYEMYPATEAMVRNAAVHCRGGD